MTEQNTQSGSMFQNALAPGAIMGITLIALSAIYYAADYDGGLTTLANIIATGAAITYFTIQYRDKKKNGFISYGQTVGFGTLMSLVSAVLNAVYFVIFITLIAPDYIATVMDKAAQKIIEQGTDEAQLETALEITKLILSPPVLTISIIFSCVLSGVIISLIVAIFVKKENYQQRF